MRGLLFGLCSALNVMQMFLIDFQWINDGAFEVVGSELCHFRHRSCACAGDGLRDVAFLLSSSMHPDSLKVLPECLG